MLNQSRNAVPFMEREGALLCSQEQTLSSSPERKNQSKLAYHVLHFVAHSFLGVLYKIKKNLCGGHVRP